MAIIQSSLLPVAKAAAGLDLRHLPVLLSLNGGSMAGKASGQKVFLNTASVRKKHLPMIRDSSPPPWFRGA
jgi:hypothetical protein